MSGRKQFSTFFVRGLFFGIEVDKVQEVLSHQEMTCVPLAPPVLRGLINLRGQIIAAIDLGSRLQLEGRAPEEAMNMVIRTSDGLVSLLVDEIGDVVEAAENTFEVPPDTLNETARAFIRGVHKLDERLMHVLNTEQTLDLDGESTAA